MVGDESVYAEFLFQRLLKLRESKGISERDMSLSIGQSKGYINKIDNRLMLPSMSAFFNICDYFDITPEEFFNTKISHPGLYSEILEAIQVLNEEQLKIVLDVARGLGK